MAPELLHSTRGRIMFRGPVMALVLGVVGMGFATLLLASRPARPLGVGGSPPIANADLLPLKEARGRVTGVDARQSRLTVQSTSGVIPFRVDRTTTIFVHGRTGGLTDLAVGQVVCATYEPASPEPLAQWIELCGS